MSREANLLNVLWLQSGGCGGCSLALMGAESPDLFQTLEGAGINLLWHPNLSEESAGEAIEILENCRDGKQPLDVLCIEGAMLCGPEGSGRFHMLSGTGQPMIQWVRQLAQKARYVMAVGTCSAFGGIPMAGDNPSDASGLQFSGSTPGGLLGPDYVSGEGLPVINVAGCPPHPDWITEMLMLLSDSKPGRDDFDEYLRPRPYADQLVHHGCPRNEYYEFKASAKKCSDLGCLMENLGCMGTQAHADCNTRLRNGSGSCVRGGFPCINCASPEFEEPGHSFASTPKIAGIPIGLPTDMPKAWFVALASLSKSATPKRVRINATADHQLVSPTVRKPGRK